MKKRRLREILFRGAPACAAAVLIYGAIMLLCGGCLGYRLGGQLPPGINSVFVPTVENDTDQPQLEAETTAAIIERFQSDGRLSIRDATSADATLQVRIVNSELTPVRYDRQASVTATEYRLTLSAEVTLIRHADHENLLYKRVVQGWEEFATDGDLPAARRDAVPEAARELGRQVVRTVVEYW